MTPALVTAITGVLVGIGALLHSMQTRRRVNPIRPSAPPSQPPKTP